MRHPSFRRLAIACGAAALAAAAIAVAPGPRAARAQETTHRNAERDHGIDPAARARARGLRAMPPAQQAGQRGGGSFTASAGWWLGLSGIALALAVYGGVSVASRRFLPGRGASPLQVVGRTSLSPKHTVYLLRAGERVLIVGTGAQGAPSLLGEWTGPLDTWLASQRAHDSASSFGTSSGDEA